MAPGLATLITLLQSAYLAADAAGGETEERLVLHLAERDGRLVAAAHIDARTISVSAEWFAPMVARVPRLPPVRDPGSHLLPPGDVDVDLSAPDRRPEGLARPG